MSTFDGFPRDGFDFLLGLGADNTKAFLDDHRATYIEAVLAVQPPERGDALRPRADSGLLVVDAEHAVDAHGSVLP